MPVTIDGTSGIAFPDGTTRAVGTSANNLVALNGSAQLPAVNGSLLTGITGKWEYIGSGAAGSGTISFINIGSYTRLVAIYFASTNDATPSYGLTVALSSNNGTSYGTARQIVNSTANKTSGVGTLTISNTNVAATSKVINPYFADGTEGFYTTSSTETVITGVINAVRFVNTSGARQAMSVALYGVP